MLIILSIPYFAIQNSRVQTYLTGILTKNISKKINSNINIGKVDIAFFHKVILRDVLIEDQKTDTLFWAESISGKIDSFKIKTRFVALKSLTFKNSKINIQRDSVSSFNFAFIPDSLLSKKDSVAAWILSSNQFDFQNSSFFFSDRFSDKQKSFQLNDLNFSISDFVQNTDSTYFKINKLNLNDGKHLNLKNFAANFTSKENKIVIDNLNFATERSLLSDAEIELTFEDKESISVNNTDIDFHFSNSKISFFELAELAPSLKGMDQNVYCSGRIYGNLDDLKGKNLLVRTGKNTSARFDFYANGLTDLETMFLFVDLKTSTTSFSDINDIKFPGNSKIKNLNFPESFYEAGLLSYTGNFTGFLSDFVAFGTFSSDMGTLSTDVLVTPDKGGSVIYRGSLATTDFEVGKLFQYKTFGEITFNGNVDGNYNKNSRSVFGRFNGEIDSLVVNNYEYRNITLDGQLDKKMFDGALQVNDPNLQFNFLGKVDLNQLIPNFNFTLELKKALPGKLNLSRNFPASEIAFNMMADFSGDKLDNLNGKINLQDGLYRNRNGELNLEGIQLVSVPGDSTNKLVLNSDFFDLQIDGIYNFQNIFNSIEKTTNYYLPAIRFEKLANAQQNVFDYQIDVKKLDELSAIFTPSYKLETPFILYGKIDSENAVFELEGSIPGFSTENLWVKNIFIGNKPLGNEYTSIFRFGEVLLKNGVSLYNLSVDSKIANNNIDNQITWTSYQNLTYSGTIKTKSVFSRSDSSRYPHINIEGLPTKIFLADSAFEIAPFTASIDSSSIEINNFRFYNSNQSISADGKISKSKTDRMAINLMNINLAHLKTYLNRDFDFSGIINGSVGIFDFYDQRLIYSDVLVDDFVFKRQLIGDVSLTNSWDKNRAILNSKLNVIKNNRHSLLVSGYFKPSTNELNYNAELDHLSLVVMESIMRKNFSNFHGDASGKIKIHGKPDNILLTGAIEGSNAGLTIDYTQVSYHFNDSIFFKGNTIHFDKIRTYDVFNNSGIFDGTITHQNFKKMVYDLNVSTPKIMVLNTSSRNNEQFFGQVVASGSLDITGQGKQVNMSGSATTLYGTNVNISLDYESEIKQYDFIEFVSTEETVKREFLFPKGNDDDFTMNINVKATPEAKAQLIYNSQIGDVIKAQGEGILLFGMDKEGDITLSGNYIVEKGDYLFTLQNVINKRFTIEQGGSLVWSGNPYNANIDLHAIYKLKASLYDLLVNTYENIYQSQRIPVECKILLTNELSNPLINFEIDFPTVEDRLIDEVQQFFNTDEEMNKQILSLLVLGKFYTPEYMRGTYEAQNPNLIGTTASELFSNQLSNWLSQISNNIDIGLNYRPGNQITNDEIELALSTQLFNDRVTINGNIGNNVNPHTNNNSQLVGDFDINVKLIPSGKIQFKAYNRSNNNLIYETAPYTQGVGFSFKEEYNTFQELLQKLAAIFRKKDGKIEKK